ncbi:hypothetical protein QR98_0104360, partial [Sarcoptes scabiei]
MSFKNHCALLKPQILQDPKDHPTTPPGCRPELGALSSPLTISSLEQTAPGAHGAT